MKPILFESNEKVFATNGIGTLSDAYSCEVREALNGEFELTLNYPINGIFSNQLALRRIVLAKPNPYTRPQPFRIYSVEKTLNVITLKAEHISYDLNGCVSLLDQGSVRNWQEYVDMIVNNCANESFEFNLHLLSNDPTKTAGNLAGPYSARKLLMIPQWDLTFDRYDVYMDFNGRGRDTGFCVRYGHNLLSYSQEDIFQNVYTHILPFFKKADDPSDFFPHYTVIYLPEKIVPTPSAGYDFQRILAVELTDKISSESEDLIIQELRDAAEEYVNSNNLGLPDPDISVDFASYHGSIDKEYEMMERVELGDTIRLIIPQYGISLPRRCVKTVFDCLKNRYSKIELGNTQKGIEYELYLQRKKIEENKLSVAYERIYNRENYARKS